VEEQATLPKLPCLEIVVTARPADVDDSFNPVGSQSRKAFVKENEGPAPKEDFRLSRRFPKDIGIESFFA
jgi:hypothetical protein